MITDYLREAMKLARYEKLEDGSFYGEIPGFQGVYANTTIASECKKELLSTLQDWIDFTILCKQSLPNLAKSHHSLTA